MSRHRQITEIEDEIAELNDSINGLTSSYFTSFEITAKHNHRSVGLGTSYSYTGEVVGNVVGEVLITALKNKRDALKARRQKLMKPWYASIFGKPTGEEK
jgi:hypothetical protein